MKGKVRIAGAGSLGGTGTDALTSKPAGAATAEPGVCSVRCWMEHDGPSRR